MSSRVIVLSVDDSEVSLNAAKWACINFVRPDDAVHLMAVMLPVSASMLGDMPAAGMAAGIMLDRRESFNEEFEKEKANTQEVLAKAKQALSEVGRTQLTTHCEKPQGGASGVAESIVKLAKRERADLVVVGSHGVSAAKNALMTVAGLGSVSSYCLKHLHCPVALVRGTNLGAPRKAVNKVLVAVDKSEAAQRALQWAVDHALGPRDELHIVCVQPAGIVTVDTMPANETACAAMEQAAHKVDRERIVCKPLKDVKGSTAGLGAVIKQYEKDQGIDMAIMGSRGMGAVKRALQSLVGTGSLSAWCANNLDCPVIVVKS